MGKPTAVVPPAAGLALCQGRRAIGTSNRRAVPSSARRATVARYRTATAGSGKLQTEPYTSPEH